MHFDSTLLKTYTIWKPRRERSYWFNWRKGEAAGKAEGEEKSFSFAGQNPEGSENLYSPRDR